MQEKLEKAYIPDFWSTKINVLVGNFDLLVKMSWNIHIFPEIDKQVFTFIKIEFRIAHL